MLALPLVIPRGDELAEDGREEWNCCAPGRGEECGVLREEEDDARVTPGGPGGLWRQSHE